MATTYRDNGRTLYSGTEAERLAYTIETSDTYEKNVFWLEPNGNEFRVIEGAWVQIKVGGAEKISATVGIEAFSGSGAAVLPVAAVPFDHYTVPVGCNSIELKPATIAITATGIAILTKACGVKVNGISALTGANFILQPGDEPIRIAVNGGDLINIIGDTATTGHVLITALG